MPIVGIDRNLGPSHGLLQSTSGEGSGCLVAQDMHESIASISRNSRSLASHWISRHLAGWASPRPCLVLLRASGDEHSFQP